MFKIKAYAVAQDPQITSKGKTKLDGWGLPLQTVYLRQNQFKRFAGEDYRRIAKHQIKFLHDLEQASINEPNWFSDNNWHKLPKIYNDPRAYDLAKHTMDIVGHYEAGHDPALSMILRQQYFVDRLATELSAPDLRETYGIDLEIVNSTAPIIKRFHDHGVFTKPQPGSVFTKIFESQT
jgi:hypothetical protein